jgi:hypothetical protein
MNCWPAMEKHRSEISGAGEDALIAINQKLISNPTHTIVSK